MHFLILAVVVPGRDILKMLIISFEAELIQYLNSLKKLLHIKFINGLMKIEPQSLKSKSQRTFFVFYLFIPFMLCTFFYFLKEKRVVIQFSPDIPHNEIKLSNFSIFQQPFYVFSLTPLKTSSLVIKKLNRPLSLLPKYGDYYHPIFKFYSFDDFFSLYLYPHNTDNEIYLISYDHYTGKLLFGFKLSFLIFFLTCILISMIKIDSNEIKSFLILTVFYAIHKIISFFASIPIEYLFQSIFFGLYIINTIYYSQIIKFKSNIIIEYTFWIFTFIVICLFYLSNLFLILQKAMHITWIIYNFLYIYILIEFNRHLDIKKVIFMKISMIFLLLNSIFFFSLFNTHIYSDKTFLIKFIDMVVISLYAIIILTNNDLLKADGFYYHEESFLSDVPIL